MLHVLTVLYLKNSPQKSDFSNILITCSYIMIFLNVVFSYTNMQRKTHPRSKSHHIGKRYSRENLKILPLQRRETFPM